MDKKYDGWTVKELRRKAFLYASDFAETRTEVVERFDKLMREKGAWKRYRRKGWMKIVKVKLVEVE